MANEGKGNTNRTVTLKGKSKMPEDPVQIQSGDVFTCGEAVKTKGKIDWNQATKAKFFCFVCDFKIKTPNEHKTHNKRYHQGEKTCNICLHPTTDTKKHEFLWPPNAIASLANLASKAGSTSESTEKGTDRNVI